MNNKYLRSALLNASLLIVSFLVTLLVLEITLRIIAHYDHNYLDNLVSKKQLVDTRGDQLGDIVRLHPDNKIVYELRPHTKGIFVGQQISINSLGMRDKERSLEKPPGVFRILALGDSHTFGWGVRQEETWPLVLEDLLSQNDPSRKFQVMNLGVPGYNTVQEVQAFSTKAEALNPDLVIINYCNNDMDLPNFLANPPDPFSLNTSYLKDFIRRRIELLKGNVLSPLGLTAIPMNENSKRFRMPTERVPERFRPLYGWDNMVDANRRLAKICRTMEIPYVFLLNFNDYRFRLRGTTPTVVPQYVRDFVKLNQEEGYLVVDPQDRIFNYLKQNDLDHTAVWITKKDSHSNSIRHRFLAEELFEQLTKASLL
jgi:lysophospholipase L1-like esterase